MIRIKRNKIFFASGSVFLCVLLLSTIPAALAQQTTVDQDYRYCTNMGYSIIMYKDTGEMDPNNDYYSLKVLLADTGWQNDDWIGPMYAGIRLAILLPDEEPPGNHLPQAGWYWSQQSVNFNFIGISYGLTLPAYNVDYQKTDDGFWAYYDWSLSGDWGGLTLGYVFDDWTEFSLGLVVPEGYVCEAYAQAYIYWYQFFFWGEYYPFNYEENHWLHVRHDSQYNNIVAPGSGSDDNDNIAGIPEPAPMSTPDVGRQPLRQATESLMRAIINPPDASSITASDPTIILSRIK